MKFTTENIGISVANIGISVAGVLAIGAITIATLLVIEPKEAPVVTNTYTIGVSTEKPDSDVINQWAAFYNCVEACFHNYEECMAKCSSSTNECPNDCVELVIYCEQDCK